MRILPVPLYHGTSTLFLAGIIESGLGGKNPLAEWRVLDFARALLPLVQQHFSQDKSWMVKAQSFGFMAQQLSASMNYQHGDAYLSPSPDTAIRYATNKKFGSELLTYSLDFLQELINRKVPGVVDNLYEQFPQVFGFLDISCAPLLIEVRAVPTDQLLDEHGRDAGYNIGQVESVLKEDSEGAKHILQQTNFRLRQSASLSSLTFWLIDVHRWHPFQPDYSLRLLAIPGAFNGDTQPTLQADGQRFALPAA